MLILESFQAGLSWQCVLNKREAFKEAYEDFDIDKVIEFDEEKIEQLRNNPNIIRNKLKIKASISHGKIIYETGKTTSTLSDSISNDLKKRGMKFVGSTIIYSFLQAIGVIYSHEKDCFLYKD